MKDNVNQMEIDSDAPMSSVSGLEPSARRRSREMNRSMNGLVLATTEVPDQNGDAAGALGLVSPNFCDELGSQHPETLGHLKTRDTSKPDQDATARLKSASFAGTGSSSEDELPEGEIAWSMPIVQPKLLATGLCYDVRMRYHCELEPPKQRLDFHPEDPRRIYHIYRELCQAGLYKDPQFDVPIIDKPLERIRARNATPSEICLVHSAAHYRFVESTAGRIIISIRDEAH